MRVDRFYNVVEQLPSVTEVFPFGPDVVVFKVGGKMFATLNVDDRPFSTNLKCDPERAAELRAEYEGIRPGYHMNKRHWNTVGLESDVPESVIIELVRHSYELVVRGLPLRLRPDTGGHLHETSFSCCDETVRRPL